MCTSDTNRTIRFLTILSLILPVLAASDPARSASLDDLVLTEIMYHPADDGTVSGDEFEFIEIKNTGTTAVDLSGAYFDSGITYVFPTGTSLEAGGFVVLASVPSRFQERYGFAPDGAFTGTLSNSGESLTLLSAQGSAIIEMEYDDETPWPIAADGSGFSLVTVSASAAVDQEDPRNWRLSSQPGGSPAADDPAAPPSPVVLVNELLAHTDPPQQDAVELHNTSESTVNIGGWYLTDDAAAPTKYRIMTGTTIPPGGFLILDEEDFNASGDPNGFSFSEAGEDVLLLEADDAGNLTGVVHGFRFAASENQVSFGRYVNSQGAEHFVRQRALTFGQENAGPRPSPVAISEVMYRTEDDSPEFIEIVNVSDGVVPLYDPTVPQNTWRIDGIAYNLPAGITLGPGEVLLAVPVDPASFRNLHGLPESVRIVGPYTGSLSNSGERVVLQQPGPPETTGEIPYIAMDAVSYLDEDPWPASADGDGPSLERIDLNAYGDDPVNWRASQTDGGTPGNVEGTRVEEPWLDPAMALDIRPLYPNPVSATATVAFQVAATQEVALTIHDLLGREVGRLFAGTAVNGTLIDVPLDATALPSGVYFLRLSGERAQVTRQFVRVR